MSENSRQKRVLSLLTCDIRELKNMNKKSGIIYDFKKVIRNGKKIRGGGENI